MLRQGPVVGTICGFSIELLHIEGISTGFISSLGEGFVRRLYEAIAQSPDAFGFVACREETVVGYVVFSTDLGSLYKSVLRKSGFALVGPLLKKMFSVSTIRRLIQNVIYPSRMEKHNLPRAELLAIVVDSQARGQGLARTLTESGLQECSQRGIDRVKVLVGAQNAPANHLYQRCGFALELETTSHDNPSNVYVADLKRQA